MRVLTGVQYTIVFPLSFLFLGPCEHNDQQDIRINLLSEPVSIPFPMFEL